MRPFIHKELVKYIAKRLGVFIVSAFVAVTVNFIIPRLMPGDPITNILGRMEERGMSIPGGYELIQEYTRRFGLDQDLFSQYLNYLRNLFQGDLGYSIAFFPMKVWDITQNALPWTIMLLVTTTIMSWVAGNLLGTFIGWHRGGKADKVITWTALSLSRIPYYFTALILVFVLAYKIPIFPPLGAYSIGKVPSLSVDFIIDAISHAILPALSILTVAVGGWMISMRSMIVNILGEDYLLLAEAKGLKKNTIMMKYAFRNALLPQITGLAMSLGFIVNGALLMESIFKYPGMGTLFINALNRQDYNLMQGVFLITTLSVLAANLLIDLIYPLVDPRITFRREE